jgi:hypothetical protein
VDSYVLSLTDFRSRIENSNCFHSDHQPTESKWVRNTLIELIMENTFNALYKEYGCKNQYQSYLALEYIFNDVGDTNSWIRKIKLIQEGVFGIKGEFSTLPPDGLIYSGQLFLKVIYAAVHLQEIPPVPKSELQWTHLICPWNERIAKRNQHEGLIQMLEYCPKHLSFSEILDPSAFIRDFFSVGTLREWVFRWNQLREYAFYQFSMMDGDEGAYLFDFDYLFKLTEATYLIYTRHAQALAKNSVPKNPIFQR